MIIQSLLKRKGGTIVDIDGVEYAFTPDSNDNHICEVKEQSHIDRFLSISEAYAEFSVKRKGKSE